MGCQRNFKNLKQIYSLIIIKGMSTEQALGRIEVIFGPMFSGKSSELLRRVRRFQHASKKCLVVNYMNDNRYEEDSYAATHDK